MFSASCYVKINQFDSAIQLMSELITVEPTNLNALYLRGKAYQQRAEYLKAYTDFKTSIAIDKNNQIVIKSIKEIETLWPEVVKAYE